MADYILSVSIDIPNDNDRLADAVIVNNSGEWLAEIDHDLDGDIMAMPLTDDDGDYIPAPDGWRLHATEL